LLIRWSGNLNEGRRFPDHRETDRRKRANALRSTGPRSLLGKAPSSQNAVKHGLTAYQAMLRGENPEELVGLRYAMFGTLNP
jgi:hypothetical protein